MSVHTPMKLVTVVIENLLRDQISTLFREHGATGYTISRVDGEGSRGVRAQNWEGPNLKFESITSEKIANEIIEAIAERYFEHYAVVAWISDVAVLRGEKFS